MSFCHEILKCSLGSLNDGWMCLPYWLIKGSGSYWEKVTFRVKTDHKISDFNEQTDFFLAHWDLFEEMFYSELQLSFFYSLLLQPTIKTFLNKDTHDNFLFSTHRVQQGITLYESNEFHWMSWVGLCEGQHLGSSATHIYSAQKTLHTFI